MPIFIERRGVFRIKSSKLDNLNISLVTMNYLLIFLLGFSFSLNAQFNFEYNNEISVSVNGSDLHNAWGGGLNSIQISDFDYDFDGDLDLFIFDRSSDNIRVYTQEGIAPNNYYALAHNSKQNFPNNIRYKALLVDYDQDGKKDLFTQGLSGLKVYRNASTISNGLQWELTTDLIYSEYVNGFSPLLVSSDDIPGLVDVDSDGDMDILTFHIGGETMEYHQNQSMEIYGIPDSLSFELKNQCWGKFREDPISSNIIINDPNSPCVGGDIPNPLKQIQHAGSTILAYDFDNSGVLDLVLGDVSFSNLTLLMNGGTAANSDSPMITSDVSFPSNTTPVEIQAFPAAFLVDVDFDGIKDLIVSANAGTVSENESSIRFYKNIGTSLLPNFIYSDNDFFQNEMIDHGLGSAPTFVDLNQDGLEDLVVANLFRYKPVIDKESTLAYYLNSGTISNPEFMLIDDDYLNLTNENFGLRTIPTFGDLDNDGDQDLILGRDNGTLVLYQNVSTGGAAVYAAPVINYADNLGQVISAGSSCFPQLFDLNQDGLLDLVLGQMNGQMILYKNVGTSSVPMFELYNSNLGNVTITNTIPNTFSAPHFFRDNDTTHLFIGDIDGRLNYFSGIDGNIDPSENFILESSNLIDLDANKYSTFWVNDLNDNGLLELYVGQDLGGLYRFENDTSSTVSLQDLEMDSEVSVYPNPTAGSINIHSNSMELQRIQIIDINGRNTKQVKMTGTHYTLGVSDIENGIYYMKVYLDSGVIVVKKIIKN